MADGFSDGIHSLRGLSAGWGRNRLPCCVDHELGKRESPETGERLQGPVKILINVHAYLTAHRFSPLRKHSALALKGQVWIEAYGPPTQAAPDRLNGLLPASVLSRPGTVVCPQPAVHEYPAGHCHVERFGTTDNRQPGPLINQRLDVFR
jgi:hypothetical protein